MWLVFSVPLNVIYLFFNIAVYLLAASQTCHLDTHMQTVCPWKIQGSWVFQKDFSRVLDKDWNKATSNTLLQTKASNMQRIRFNKVYKPIKEAGFHIQAVYCKISQGDIV